MIEGEELASLLPHRGSMLLLTRVNEYNLERRTLCAESHITEDCLFYDPVIKGVPAWVAFEFLAQSIAALSGLWSREKGENPQIGFILSVSSIQIGLPLFSAGTTVELRLKENDRMDQVFNFKGEVFLEDRKVMEGKLTVMEVNDEHIKSML